MALSGTFTATFGATGVHVSGTGATLSVAGQTLSGDFAFDQSGSTTHLVASSVTLTLGSFFTLDQGQGSLTVAAGGVSGTLSAHVATNNVPRFALSGNVSIAFGSGFVHVVASGLSVSVVGQSLSGDFTFQQSGGTTTATVANGTLALAGLSLTHGTGTLTITAGGVAGSISGDVAVSIPGVSFTGALALQIDTAGGTLSFAATGASLTVAGQALSGDFTFTPGALTVANAALSLGGALVTLTGASAHFTTSTAGLEGTFAGTLAGFVSADLFTADIDTRAATRHVRITGTGVHVTVAGQSLGGDFTFEQSGAGVTVTVHNGTLQLGSVVNVQHADGTLVKTSAGVTADLSVTQFTFTLGTGISLGLDPGGSVTIHVDPSSLSVRVLKGALTIAGNRLAGDFAFDQSSGVTRFAAANVSVAVSVGGASATLTNGEGGFVVLGTGVAGFLTGKASVAAGGIAAGGDLLLRVNETGQIVDQTIDVGGRSIHIAFTTNAATFEVSFSNATLTIGDFVTIEGSVSFSSDDSFSGSDLSVFVGRGPFKLGTDQINPLAVGVLITGAKFGLVKSGASYAFYASGIVSLIGVAGASIGGTATVTFNSMGSSQDVSTPDDRSGNQADR